MAHRNDVGFEPQRRITQRLVIWVGYDRGHPSLNESKTGMTKPGNLHSTSVTNRAAIISEGQWSSKCYTAEMLAALEINGGVVDYDAVAGRARMTGPPTQSN